jgi:MerR family transcriptional regulator, thiopeptide resistance regulator
MGVTVGRLAALAGVTVRTLHHYDEIGLLAPNGRSTSGYRLYSEGDLERLQQILFYRELGFPLEEIATILDDPDTDSLGHLRRQHALLTRRADQLTEMIAAVEKAMEAATVGISLTPEERFEVFGEHDPQRYADEAEQRWGDTEAYQQSRRRTATYTKQDWKRVMAEQQAVTEAFAAALRSGLAPGDEAAMDLAERHRGQIDSRFYECSYAMHRKLGELYTEDPRFTEFYDTHAPGLAVFVRDAIAANADRHEG